FFFFFFFQAEDGIRDKLVTGVQTCALPIYRAPGAAGNAPRHRQRLVVPRGLSQPARTREGAVRFSSPVGLRHRAARGPRSTKGIPLGGPRHVSRSLSVIPVDRLRAN